MEVLVFEEASTPRDLRLQMLGLQHQAWPEPGGVPTEPVTVHDPSLAPRSMLLVDDGRVIAALDVLTKGVVVGAASYVASGLSTVVTDAARRGRGHGHRLVVAAREWIGASGADLAIFTCDEGLAGFYERAGFRVLPGTVLIGGTEEDPFPSEGLGKVTLGAFFTERARSNEARFAHARIELFPGTIDRLW